MVKAIFFDIDGTLLSMKTHRVPDSARRALEELRRKGIKLFLATGRSPAWLGSIEGMLDFKFDGYVMLNGQYCIFEGQVLRDVAIPLESLEPLIPYIEEAYRLFASYSITLPLTVCDCGNCITREEIKALVSISHYA